jgi:glycosyltransferase involved in cell wall biosynthesis
VVTEALLTGLPVLASAVGGVPGQIGDAGMLITPNGGESLVPAITAVVADYDTYARRAVTRSDAVATEYSVDQMISRHVDLYRGLRGRTGP